MNALVRMGLVAMIAVGVTACSEHQDLMGPGDNQGEVVEIEIRNFEFSMPDLTIAPGTTVRWRNTTSSFHTVTPDGHSAWEQWETAANGDVFEVTFNQVGTFGYYCLPHRALGMTGVITVS